MANKEETIVIISEVRDLIDKVDESIVWYIMLRLTLARLIMKVKSKQGVPVEDLNREKEIIDSVEEYVRDNYRGPSRDFEELFESVGGIFNQIISLGKNLHRSQL